MSASTSPAQPESAADVAGVNEIRLVGRISAAPTERVLPSGAKVVVFRLVVPRVQTVMTRGSRQRSDWMDCSAWSGEQRRRVARWQEGDQVEITGAVRRRHYRVAQGASSVVEIEVLGGRRVQRSGSTGRGAAP